MENSYQELSQEIFKGQPKEVNWCGVDYDGLLSFGIAVNPRYTWASERWRGFDLIGEPIENTNYKPLTSLHKKIECVHDWEFVGSVGGAYCFKCGQWDESTQV